MNILPLLTKIAKNQILVDFCIKLRNMVRNWKMIFATLEHALILIKHIGIKLVNIMPQLLVV